MSRKLQEALDEARRHREAEYGLRGLILAPHFRLIEAIAEHLLNEGSDHAEADKVMEDALRKERLQVRELGMLLDRHVNDAARAASTRFTQEEWEAALSKARTT